MKDFSVIENIMIPAPLKGLPKQYVINIAVKLINQMSLQDKINAFPDNLSSGEAQRVSIARALINSPKLLIADEPTSSFDRKHSTNN